MRTIRCNNCGQLLKDNQKICPSCKQSITDPVVENNLIDSNSFTHFAYVDARAFMVGICIFICVIIMVAFYFTAHAIIDSDTNHININHTETPIDVKDFNEEVF